jgi:hypothetical protein
MPKINLSDSIVIYHSSEDRCWVAHSLRTDQIGTGDDVVTALAAVIRGLDSLCELAEEDETIAYLREAPPEIQAMEATATPLLKELFEIAHKKARGEWPDDQPVTMSPDERATFKAQELVC